MPFAAIGEATVAKLAARLDFGLEPENPCDAFGTGHDYDGILRDCFQALVDDDDTALGVFFLDLQQDNATARPARRPVSAVRSNTAKPVALATNYCAVDHRELAGRSDAPAACPCWTAPIAALKAVRERLRAARLAQPSRRHAGDRATRRSARAGASGWPKARRSTRPRASPCSPTTASAVPDSRVAVTQEEAGAAAAALGLPVVMKTAMPGIHHKSDVGGVKLSLAERPLWPPPVTRSPPGSVPRVLVAPMAGAASSWCSASSPIRNSGRWSGRRRRRAGRGLGDAAALVAPAPPSEVRDVLDGLARASCSTACAAGHRSTARRWSRPSCASPCSPPIWATCCGDRRQPAAGHGARRRRPRRPGRAGAAEPSPAPSSGQRAHRPGATRSGCSVR